MEQKIAVNEAKNLLFTNVLIMQVLWPYWT